MLSFMPKKSDVTEWPCNFRRTLQLSDLVYSAEYEIMISVSVSVSVSLSLCVCFSELGSPEA